MRSSTASRSGGPPADPEPDTQRGRRRFDSLEAFEDWLSKAASSRFDRRHVYSCGNLTALYDAIQQALEDVDNGVDSVRVPRWVLDALDTRFLNAVMPTFLRKAKTGRPKQAWSAARWRRDMIDWIRFREVWYRRIARRADSPPHAPPKEQRRARREFQVRSKQAASFVVDVFTPYPWTPGRDPDDWSVFEAASKVLANSIYQGSPALMRKSYETVTATLKRGEAWRYYPSKWVRYDERQILATEAEHAR